MLGQLVSGGTGDLAFESSALISSMNVLNLGGERNLVSPRGQTDWVRNLRVCGHRRAGRRAASGDLHGHRDRRPGHGIGTAADIALTTDAGSTGTATVSGSAGSELAIAVLRAYLRRWMWEVGQFFDDVGPDSTDAELLAVAARHLIFRVVSVTR